MPQSQLEEILEKIHTLQLQLEREFEELLNEKRGQFQYTLRKGRVIFDKNVREFQRHHRTGLWLYLRHAKPKHYLTAPIIYSIIVPMVLIDLFIFIYQQVCFRAYGIPLVRRTDYIVIDRHHLAYLNVLEKFNCVYCGYGNGLIEYVREVFARTEQYWCPVKHARRALNSHQRIEKFADYGDASAYRKKLIELRQELHDNSDLQK